MIGIFTTSRADYGLIEPLIKLCHENKKLKLFVAGSHCSPEFGLTIKDIRYPITERFDTLMSSDTESGVIKSASITMLSIADALTTRHKLKWLVVLGDRFESLAIAMTARVARVPIAHISGGDLTGNYDDSFRHAITQLASLHFVYCNEYRDRVVQMGSNPDTVHVIGFIGLDGLEKREQGRKFNHLTVSYHPETLKSRLWNQANARTLLAFLAERPEQIAFTIPNADNGGRWIRDAIKQFCEIKGNASIRSFTRGEFIKVLLHTDVLIGNSSAGIYEAPALGVPTINVGDRQKGRRQAPTIINTETSSWALDVAFKIIDTDSYQSIIKRDYPLFYEGRDSAQQIYHILDSTKPEIEKEWYA